MLGCLLAGAGSAWAAKKAPATKAPPPPPQDIVLRHALNGAPLDTLATLVLRFNDTEARMKRGGGRILIEASQGLSEPNRLPHLALFDQEDALLVFGTRPRFLALHKVMAAGGQRFDTRNFYPQMVDAVSDLSGKMQALPLGMSVPVLFYNRAAFGQAGLAADAPPATWWELQEAAGALRDAGFKCPLTSSRFTWVHIENIAAQHAEPMVVKEGRTERLALNNMVNVKHLALLSSWYKSFYFIYSGPGREGEDRFASGECAMLTGESALNARLIREKPDFPMGIALLPHYDDVYGAKPTHVLPDGAALWVLAADKKPEQQVIARFISFLLKPEVQREWVRATGFLPMTSVAVQALREAGVDSRVLALAEQRLSMPGREAARTHNGNGRSRIRAILNEEVEFVWGNRKPAKEALDTAVMRAGPVLSPIRTAQR